MANKNIFNSIEASSPKKNMFDLSHDVKLSCNMGELIPVNIQECIPGDKWNCSVEALLRLQPLVSPMMHRVNTTFHTYFVPSRLLWAQWENFITNTKVAGVLPAMPYFLMGSIEQEGAYSRLADYLGIPTPPADALAPKERVSALPFAAYQLIYDQYYRDQNLVTTEWQSLNNGDNSAQYATGARYGRLRTRAWEHDYFTSALPFAQKGDPVTLPIAGNAPIKITNPIIAPGDTQVGVNGEWLPSHTGTTIGIPREDTSDIGDNKLYADLGSTNATTINDLRRANALQRFLEKMARGGSRLTEMIYNIFGVKNPDSRLQRPEYITGSIAPMVISEVLNTTGDTGATDPLPQGNMSGHGISVANGNYGGYYVQEHGYIITIMSILPKPAYQQGIPKMFLKTLDPYQFFFPDFANIGEQPIENKEVYAYTANGADTFGYTPRYAEYKYAPNRVCADMRTTLNFWHMGRIFATPPLLNQSFIEADPTHRVFAVTDPTDQKVIAHVFNKLKVVRGMPKFGTPTF